MKMLWLLACSFLLPPSLPARAAKPAPAPWVKAFDIPTGGTPRAVLFDAGTASLLISLNEGDGARLDRYSLQGKLQEKGVMKAAGEAGPLRAYDVNLFWIAGGKLHASGPHGRGLTLSDKFAAGGFTDVTVLRGAKPLAVGPAGLTSEAGLDSGFTGATGVYQYLNDVYVLAKGKLGRVGEGKSVKICDDCRWLERNSAGDWLFVEGRRVVRRGVDRRNQNFLEFASAPGRPAYVFQKDPADDLFAVPIPEEGVVRVFRAAPQTPSP